MKELNEHIFLVHESLFNLVTETNKARIDKLHETVHMPPWLRLSLSELFCQAQFQLAVKCQLN